MAGTIHPATVYGSPHTRSIAPLSDGRIVVIFKFSTKIIVYEQDTLGDLNNWTDLVIPNKNKTRFLIATDSNDNIVVIGADEYCCYTRATASWGSWSSYDASATSKDLICDKNDDFYIFYTESNADVLYRKMTSFGTFGSEVLLQPTTETFIIKATVDMETGDIWTLFANRTAGLYRQPIYIKKIGGASAIAIYTTPNEDASFELYEATGDILARNGRIYILLSDRTIAPAPKRISNTHIIYSLDPDVPNELSTVCLPNEGICSNHGFIGAYYYPLTNCTGCMNWLNKNTIMCFTSYYYQGSQFQYGHFTPISINLDGKISILKQNAAFKKLYIQSSGAVDYTKYAKLPFHVTNPTSYESGSKMICAYINATNTYIADEVSYIPTSQPYNIGSGTSPIPSSIDIAWVGGKVQINFTATDAEDDDCNVIRLPSLIQYSDNNGASWYDCDIQSLSGTLGIITASSGGTSHVADLFFDFFKQLAPNIDIAQFKIRMKLDDGNSSSAAYVESSNVIPLTTDTKKWSMPHIERARLDGLI